jgi:hypothetical protein
MQIEKFISINWYIDRKPYNIHSGYDLFYLVICRRLYSIIDGLVEENREIVELHKEDCREIAYVITAYFEDQVNCIGFWRSLVQLHQKKFGKRLPFFDEKILKEQEEEWEDVLPADIHYLLFISYLNFVSNEGGKALVFFNKELFVQLTEKIVDCLNEIEEVPTTDFYQNYLAPDEDYIDFKHKLDWFTYESYLTSIEFSRNIDDYLWKLMDQNVEKSLLSPLMYEERDRLMFEEPSSLTAFFPLDILAGAMRCSETKKEEIRQLKFRPHGIFHVQQETDTHYLFLHTSTSEEFTVTKKSFKEPFDSRKEEYWIATIASWSGEHHISGLCVPSPYEGEEIYHRNLQMQHNFQKHFAPYRQHLTETAVQYRNKAADFFGSNLIVFETGYQLQQKLNEFEQWYFNTVADKSKISDDAKPVQMELPKDILEASKPALFIPTEDGLQFVMQHEQLLHLLQTKETDKVSLEQIQEMLPMLFDDSVGVEYWFYLRKHFPLPNLSLFLKCPVEADEDFEALLRIYRSSDFSPLKLPRFTTFTSERISPETAREIFELKKE